MKYDTFLKKATKFGELIGIVVDDSELKSDEHKTNGWGGYEDGEDRLLVLKGEPDRPKNHRAFIVSTCRNCGDGNWTNVTSAILKIKS